MTDERQSGVPFESWLKDTDPMPPDARPNVARVMARVPQTRQRGRWWPLPLFDRPLSTFPSRELAPAPIPTTNGLRPVRGFTMFSAVKFVAAAALVALFGSFLFAGALTTPQEGEVVPAADGDDGYLVTSVTGDYKYAEGERFEADKTIVGDGYLTQNRDLEQKRIYEWDDPRLSGALELRFGWDEFRIPGTARRAYVEWGEATLRDDEGAWEGPFFGTKLPDASSYNLQLWLDGSGAYEGLYAVLTLDDARSGDQDIAGLIVKGELPPFAGAPAE